MAEKPAIKALYTCLESGEVRLLGQRCNQCGSVAFPRQPYGCEACGCEAADTTLIDFEARGKIISWATVYYHHNKKLEEPFIIGEIQLQNGITIRARTDLDSPIENLLGTEVHAEIRTSEIAGKSPKQDMYFVAGGQS